MLLLCAGLYAALAGFLFGYDLGCINGALPVLLNDTSLALSDEQAEQIVAHCKVGAAVGALISILLMQHGHLRSFWASSLCFVAGPLLLAGSRSWPVLALGRFITGLAVVRCQRGTLAAWMPEVQLWRIMLGLPGLPAIPFFYGIVMLFTNIRHFKH